jgi:hypothetical protein
MRGSVWVVLARSERDMGRLAHAAPRWVRIDAGPGPVWTDDYTNVLGALQ